MTWKGLQAILLVPSHTHPFPHHSSRTAYRERPKGLSMPSLGLLHMIHITAVISRGNFSIRQFEDTEHT